MLTKITLDRPVIVEGKYDKITLSSVLDAHILTTNGFSLFRQEEKVALIRRLGEAHGIFLLTDSDGGGRQIRSFLSSVLPKEKITHLYIPQIAGKEKRKKEGSKAGFLGVEGMSRELLYKLFAPYAADAPKKPKGTPITKVDLFADGLSGGEHSRALREALCLAYDLPRDMTANALLEALNLLSSKEEYTKKMQEIRENS